MEDGFAGPDASSGTDEAHDTKYWVSCFKASFGAGTTYQQEKLQAAWSRNYRAFQNRHMTGSKYNLPNMRNRSKLFKPKTRAAVRKNDASAAAALFSTQDVVSVTADRASDKLQASTAMFLHEALNYRLDRANPWAGPNWFLTSMGARQDAQITGICVTKQYWEYEELKTHAYEDQTQSQPMLDDTGAPILDMLTGEPLMEDVPVEKIVERTEIIKDRPNVLNIPPEHAIIDVTGDWRDPIQEGGFFIAVFPVRSDDVQAIIKAQAARNKMGGGVWREDALDKVTQAKTRPSVTQNVGKAREDGDDRYQSRFAGKEDDQTLWLYEFFYRDEGEDWHMWMLGENIVLSDPKPTIEAYPEQRGLRPYVRGLGALETHKTHPMAPVESWQPMQLEINDVTNLNLDAMKMSISPITKIKRGSGVDLKQAANRGPDATLFVTDMDDVEFDRAPSPDRSSFEAVSTLSNDFDDLAGAFSQSSVSNNRQLNETVGGMNLLSQNANSLTEFDLRVWVETWCEPVLAQLIRLIRYYESDETVIQVAGENAGLIENLAADPADEQKGLDPNALADPANGNGSPMGHNGGPPMGGMGQQPVDPTAPQGFGGPQDGGPGQLGGMPQPQQAAPPPPPPAAPKAPKITVHDVLNNLDKAQVSVRVDVGIGAMNSSQKLEKFGMGMKMTGEMVPVLKEQGIEVNAAAVLQEVWGLCGYKDADRFFVTKKSEPPGVPPEVQLKQMEMQAKMEQLQAQLQERMAEAQLSSQTQLQIERMQMQMDQQRINLEAQAFAHQQRLDALGAHIETQNHMMTKTHGAIDRLLQAHQQQTAADQSQQSLAAQREKTFQDAALARESNAQNADLTRESLAAKADASAGE